MSIIFYIVSIILIAVGFLIKKYTLVDIIAGYDAEKTKDKEGLAKWVGNNVLIMGLLSLGINIAADLFFDYTALIIAVFIIIIVGFSMRAALGCKKYEHTA